ncbi:MAG: DUF420 domain-containing protein [Proteobacteria bacterium]|nr:DUF420 domain-containing protein [Pseudomonadota bacterium]
MQWLTGPNVILALKLAVSLVTVLLVWALWAVWRKKFRLHGRINIVFVFLTVTTLIVFEVAIRIVKPDIYDYIKADPLLFQRLKIHLWFSVPAAIMMPVMLWSGLKRYAKLHRMAAVVFLVVWTLTFLTGVFFLPHKAAAQDLSAVYFHSGGRKVQLGFPGSLREAFQGNPEYIEVVAGENSAPARISKIMIGAPAKGVAVADFRAAVSGQFGFKRFAAKPFLADAIVAVFDHPFEALHAANNLVEAGMARFAHPDIAYEVEARGFAPWQEPLLGQQWHMDYNGTLNAWRLAESRNLVPQASVVALLDLGFETGHHDLADAWLQNGGEVPGNKKDDDGNGLIDDVAGWNFATNSNNLLYGASNKHGTATAGIIGARGNGRGVAGACPWCQILPVVVDNSSLNQAAAFRYAHSRGARVFSNSWGYRLNPPVTDVVVEAIKDVARDSVIVFAMSNANSNDCRASSPDISALDEVIAVSSVGRSGQKVRDSGYGPCLDLVAPSNAGPADAGNPLNPGIVTTDRVGAPGYNTGNDSANLPDGDYTNSFWGTSAAAPQVAASAAILRSFVPAVQPAAIKSAMTKTAKKVGGPDAGYDASGLSERYGYGMIDVSAALGSLMGPI